MNHDEYLQKQNKVLDYLSNLPRMIVTLHGRENTTEFVLHDLCHEDCFNLNKAAYFVDNPDFDSLKGVAGFFRDEGYRNEQSIWEKPEDFSGFMRSSKFNQMVRNVSDRSFKRNDNSNAMSMIKNIAHILGFGSHVFCSWPMKHENYGLLIYEKATDNSILDDYLLNGLSLLSFCPIF